MSATDDGIDHAARAARLREFYAEWSKVNDDSLADVEPPVELEEEWDAPDEGDEPDPSRVPYRYVANTWDGSSTWLEFDNELDSMRETLESAIHGEVPWAPGDVLDLDTGERHTSYVKVSLARLTHAVRWSYTLGKTEHHVEWRFPSEDAANEQATATRRDNDQARNVRVEALP
jgi:hypothetical protein